MARRGYDKDPYAILGVSREATGEEIKRAYRQMALRFHPDRNPGNKEAEEHFKQASEAYGVLIDPEKRRRYDAYAHSDFQPGPGAGFAYTQEEIFRDIFNNPMASEVFSDLGREFARMGLRFDDRFLENLFFSGQGVFFGRIIFAGPGGFRSRTFGGENPLRDFAGASIPHLENILVPRGRTLKGRILSWLGKKVLGHLLRKSLGHTPEPAPGALDLVYTLPLDRDQAADSSAREVGIRREGKIERITVKIPPGVRDGTLLRLRGKGKREDGRSGDLYLKIKLQ